MHALLSGRQHSPVKLHSLADVEGAAQKSQMVLHVHMEKTIFLPVLELKTRAISKGSLRSQEWNVVQRYKYL